VVLGVKEDFTREVLTVVNHPTESSKIWEDIFQDLKSRGLERINLCVSDGLPGITDAVEESFYGVNLQLCTVHFKRDLYKYASPKDKRELMNDLKQLFKTRSAGYTYKKAKEQIEILKIKWSKYKTITKAFESKRLKYYFTYLDYEPDIQNMIYTTNWIERLNKNFKISMNIRQSMPNSESALALLFAVVIKITESTNI